MRLDSNVFRSQVFLNMAHAGHISRMSTSYNSAVVIRLKCEPFVKEIWTPSALIGEVGESIDESFSIFKPSGVAESKNI